MKNAKINSNNKPKEEKVHTSVSLRIVHIEEIRAGAEKCNMNVNDFMNLLLSYGAKRHLAHAKENRRIVYQASTKDFKTVNLYMTQREYEKNLDSRRFFKYGVSWMLAFAIVHLLAEVIYLVLNNQKALEPDFLNSYKIPETFMIKQKHDRIKMCAIWYPNWEKKPK